ncbi:MAG: AAA family ATPase, partial [Proteobacteria bacterium]|nr:AAA family ATPase [Pseudomonadota bacterium]
MFTRTILSAALFAAVVSTSATAQTAPATPAAAPAAAPAAPAPSWQQGRSAEQAASPLHPFAPHMTGRPAKDLPVDKLKVPAGFKVEVWADDVPEARFLALGSKGTVFVSNRNAKNVYAIVDKNGKRAVKTLLKGLNTPNGIVFDKGTLSDGEGREIDFRNTTIILTSNLATDLIMQACDDEELPTSEVLAAVIRPQLSRHFKPALLARMTIVPFFPLKPAILQSIARLKLGKLASRLKEAQKVDLVAGDEIIAAVAARCT